MRKFCRTRSKRSSFCLPRLRGVPRVTRSKNSPDSRLPRSSDADARNAFFFSQFAPPDISLFRYEKCCGYRLRNGKFNERSPRLAARRRERANHLRAGGNRGRRHSRIPRTGLHCGHNQAAQIDRFRRRHSRLDCRRQAVFRHLPRLAGALRILRRGRRGMPRHFQGARQKTAARQKVQSAAHGLGQHRVQTRGQRKTARRNRRRRPVLLRPQLLCGYAANGNRAGNDGIRRAGVYKRNRARKPCRHAVPPRKEPVERPATLRKLPRERAVGFFCCEISANFNDSLNCEHDKTRKRKNHLKRKDLRASRRRRHGGRQGHRHFEAPLADGLHYARRRICKHRVVQKRNHIHQRRKGNPLL